MKMAERSRRSLRVVAHIPISVLVGDDPPRPAVTAVINRHGALILSPTDYALETVVWIRNEMTSASARCRVVWAAVKDGGSMHKLGVEFIDETMTFWDPAYTEKVQEAASSVDIPVPVGRKA